MRVMRRFYCAFTPEIITGVVGSLKECETMRPLASDALDKGLNRR